MIPDTREQVLAALAEEFNNEERTIRDVWIYSKAVPKKYRPRVVEICQNALRNQERATISKL